MTNQEAMRGRARKFLCDGGGGFEDGEDGIRACTISGEYAIELMAAFTSQEVASRDARIAELEKAAMAQSSVGTITYTTSIGQSIPQDEWELRRKRTLAEEEG